MKKISHSKFLRCLWLAVALHILNFSIDNPDLQSASTPEDLTYNEIETFVEFALENVLGIENAIPEYDDADADNTLQMHKQIAVDLYWHDVVSSIPQEVAFQFEEKEKISSDEFKFYVRNIQDRNFQPPEA